MWTNINEIKEYDFTEDWDKENLDKDAYKNYHKKEPLEKYFIYKMSFNCPKKTYGKAFKFWEDVRDEYADKNGKEYKYYIKDPDTYSEKLQEIYEKIYEYNLKITRKDGRICGDTMNSITTTMSKYFRWIFADDKKYYASEIKENGFVDKDRKPYKGSLSQSLEIYLKEKNSDKLKELKDTVEEFISYNHTLGNFIPVPAGAFNKPRSSSTNDYWDLTLYYIYKWYKAVEGKSVDEINGKIKQNCSCSWYGDNLCTLLEKDCQCVKKCIEWLCLFSEEDKPSWDEFVERNFLSMYVCHDKGHYGMPKLLWCNGVKKPMELEGKELEEKWKERIKDNKKPDKESCENYFRNAKECICERSKKIAEKLYEAYAKEVENEKN